MTSIPHYHFTQPHGGPDLKPQFIDDFAPTNTVLNKHIKKQFEKRYKGGALTHHFNNFKNKVKNQWEVDKHIYKYAIPATVLSALATAYLTNSDFNIPELQNFGNSLSDASTKTLSLFPDEIKRFSDNLQTRNLDKKGFTSELNNFLKSGDYTATQRNNIIKNSWKRYPKVGYGFEPTNTVLEKHIKKQFEKRYKGGALTHHFTNFKNKVKKHWEANKHIYKYAIPATVLSALASIYFLDHDLPNLPNMPDIPNIRNMPNIPNMPNMPNMPNIPNIQNMVDRQVENMLANSDLVAMLGHVF